MTFYHQPTKYVDVSDVTNDKTPQTIPKSINYKQACIHTVYINLLHIALTYLKD